MKSFFSLFMGVFLLAMVTMTPNAFAQENSTQNPTIADRFKINIKTNYDANEKNLKIAFSNIFLLKELKYRVKYLSNDKPHIIYGEIKPYTNNDIERNLRLGDCSGEACTYDGKVEDVTIEYIAEYYFLGDEDVNISLTDNR